MKAVKTLVLNSGTAEEMRQGVHHYLDATWDIEDKLYESLAADEAFYKRADPLRHPLIFYLGHTAVFYINKLNVGKVTNHRVNPRFESIFAIGVDEMSWDDLNIAQFDWPSVAEVREYRLTVRDYLHELVDSLPLEMPINWDNPWWVIVMGMEHQRIHLETSSVLIRQLPLQYLKHLDFWEICPDRGEAPKNSLVEIPGGKVTLGRGDDDSLYGWDNEYGRADYEVESFKASKYLVSNNEFLGFIEAGGYQTEEYWTEEGWAWKLYQKAEMPRFWIREGSGYKLRTMASLIDLPLNWPVEVNYLEAKAFCNWMSRVSGTQIRLPMEEEWMHVRELFCDSGQPYWEKAPGNINLEGWASPMPVDTFAFGDLYDVIGNVWQWTETPIYGLPGFKIHPAYDDFSTPTFDGKHNLIKGGSWISTGNEALKHSRYAFRRHFYQHAGFRYIETAAPIVLHDLIYESDPELCRAASTDWGRDFVPENQYPKGVMQALEDLFDPWASVLHIGCKTGRISFELAPHFAHLTGVDFTARMVMLAQSMLDSGYFRYLRDAQGEIQSYQEARLADFELEADSSKLEFWQADLSNLMPKFSGYDLIFVDATLSRSTNPGRFLQTVHERLNRGGYLVISEDWDWQEAYTLKDNWIGGTRRDGEPFTSAEALAELLSGNFEKIRELQQVEKRCHLRGSVFESRFMEISIWRVR